MNRQWKVRRIRMSENKNTNKSSGENYVPDLNIMHDVNGNPRTKNKAMSDLISDKDLDEMQKDISYRAAFKCFRFMYWAMLAASLLMMFFYAQNDFTDIYMFIASIVTECIASGACVYYVASTAKKGAMNSDFAKASAKSSWGYVIATVLYFFMMLLLRNDIFIRGYALFLTILYASFIAVAFLAKKNQKVIDEMNKESDNDE
jgi:hypothetical protein